MSKKQFIALANAIKEHNRIATNRNMNVSDSKDMKSVFDTELIDTLANFCQSQNPAFKRDRWLGYIAGENGPNGGAK